MGRNWWWTDYESDLRRDQCERNYEGTLYMAGIRGSVIRKIIL